MKKIVIVNPTKCTATSTIASSRIASFLSEITGGHLMHTEETVELEAETAIFVNGMWGFCGFRDESWNLAKKAKNVIYVANDYAISVPKAIKERKHIKIANYTSKGVVYVNWNKLTHDNSIKQVECKKNSGLFYYGAHRKDRVASFSKYFKNPRPYQMTITCSAKAKPEFKTYDQNMRFVDNPMDPMVFPGNFEAGLYIEDEVTHENYHSPANRYYEMLSSGVLMLFDAACKNTFTKTGIDVSPWLVNSQIDVAQKIRNRESLLRLQKEKLANGKNYKLELMKEVQETLHKCGLATF